MKFRHWLLLLAVMVMYVTTAAADFLAWLVYMVLIMGVALGMEWWRQRTYRRERTLYVRDIRGRDRL